MANQKTIVIMLVVALILFVASFAIAAFSDDKVIVNKNYFDYDDSNSGKVALTIQKSGGTEDAS